MKKNQREWLYEKWLKDHKETEEKKKLSHKLGVDKEKIVVKKVSTFGKIIEVGADIFLRLLYFAVIIIITFLLSLAATVILNPELRNYVFEVLRDSWL